MYRRVNDTVEEVTVHPAKVDFQDILDATEIVPDDECRNPFEGDDYLDHDLVPCEHEEQHESEAHVHFGHRDFSNGARPGHHLIVPKLVTPPSYWRDRGASRQTAAEMHARERQGAVECIQKVYRGSMEWWGVKCDYMGFHDSLWGIIVWCDDPPDYLDECKEECASVVANEMEQAGFEVVNVPDRKLPAKERYHWVLSRVNEQNWR